MASAQINYSAAGKIPPNNTVYLGKGTDKEALPIGIVVKSKDSYYLLTLSKKPLMDGASQLLAEKRRSPEHAKKVEASPQWQAYVTIFSKKDLLEQMQVVSKLEGVKIKGPLTFDQLHNNIVVKNGFPDELFGRALNVGGEGMQTPAKPTSKFGKAAVYMPDNLQPSRKKNILDLPTAAKKLLATRGLDWLIMTGNIKVTTLPGKTAGHYVIGTQDISIDSKGHNLASGTHTIIHELGHKLYYLSMNAKEHGIIKKVYDDNKSNNEIDMDRITKISTRYIGKSKTIDKKLDYVFTHVENGDKGTPPGWYAVAIKRVRGKVELVKSQKAVGPYTPDKLALDFALPKKSKWFPSEYSRSDDKEFFAELFAEWLEGRLEKLPAAWIDRVTKPYQR